MITKTAEKNQAILLRKQGKTYAEILRVIPVAKSSLSLWLRDVGLAKRQFHRLTERKRAAGRRGGEARLRQKKDRLVSIISNARQEIGAISHRELFLIGVALYWAEGSKEKSYRPGQGFVFGNMDPKMILVVIWWLERVCKIKKSMLVFELYLHRSHEYRLSQVKTYWETTLGIPQGSISRVYFKHTPINPTKRKNVDEAYHGLIRIRVSESSTLVRKIAGWTEGIITGV